MDELAHNLTLRVAKAVPRDAGRGMARLDPADMECIGAKVGDVVLVDGRQRSTVLKIMPAYLADRGKRQIRIDGIARENAGAGLDERVSVTVTRMRPAQAVTLTPIGAALTPRMRDASCIGPLVDGLVVQSGDRVERTADPVPAAEFQGQRDGARRPRDHPPGHARSRRGRGRPRRARRGVPKVSYGDIGGLGQAVARVRETIDLPLRYPEVFDRLGIDPPRGVLLYGPPGCGKTLLARAVASETALHFIHVNGPEIIHKFYGDEHPAEP